MSGNTRAGRPRKAPSTTPNTPHTAGGQTGTPNMEASVASTGGGGVSAMPTPSFGSSGPVNPNECEHMASILQDPQIPTRRKLDIATELRDSAENNRDYAFYEKYLAILIPCVLSILGDEKSITFAKDSVDQRYRHALFTWLQRLQHSDPFKAHVSAIMELMIKLMKNENEDNALTCIKIMIDGFRNHKEQGEPFVEPFLELVKQIYSNTKNVVEKEFGAPTPSKGAANNAGSSTSSPPAPTPDQDQKQSQSQAPTPATAQSQTSQAPQPPPPATLPRASQSPKVLTECPIAVVLIFQTFKPVMQPAMLDFYPLVMDSIRIQPEPQRVAHAEGTEKGEIFVGVAAGIKNREMYTELIKAQVKTMAFLAYVMRGSQTNAIKEYLDVFPEACIRLLRDCPPEDVSTRKELLVATRHILTADSRASFVPYIDILLEERVLVGTGITSHETLRPLAYSVVADLIHHVRNELSLQRLARVVYVFSCNLNDPTFTSAIQTMCAKLLNTVIESIYSKGDPVEANRLMQSMFLSALDRLMAMTDVYDRLKAAGDRDREKRRSKAITDDKGDKGDVDMEGQPSTEQEQLDRQAHGWREIEKAMPVHAVAYAHDSHEMFCREARYLFKTLLHTFRSILTYTRQSEQPGSQPDGVLLGKFFQHALRCLAIWDGNKEPRDSKEALELLSQILLQMEPHVFTEVWKNNMEFFVDQSIINPQIFPVLQMLITHESVSHQLVGTLLKYLMTRLEDIGTYDKPKAALALRLFKMSFLAINTHIATNEVVLVPHLQDLIMKSFSYAVKCPDPAIYYQILRALFRSIGGGRFEALYKEVLPILQEMLDTLAYLLQHAETTADCDLFVELTLTVPVRLTNLLPHLSYLMKPLVHALQGGTDLISQGLRTLELCIDNLTADFLDPTMGPVLRDLMAALHHLLRPIPANRQHSNAAVKILGKLGGRNRRFLEVELDLDYQQIDADLLAFVSFGAKSQRLSLHSLVDAAAKAVDEEAVGYYEDALEILMLAAMTVFQDDGQKPENNMTLSRALSGLFRACCQENIAERAKTFVRSFCKRILSTEILRTEAPRTESGRYIPDIGRSRRHLPLTTALEECFVNTLASANTAQREPLCDLLATIISDFRDLASKTEAPGRPDLGRSAERLVFLIATRFSNLCHEEEWSRKLAGVAAINVFYTKVQLSRKLLLELEIDFIRALLFSVRDVPKDAPRSSDKVFNVMKSIITTCQGSEDGRSRLLPRLTETLVIELNSQSDLSRRAAQECLATLAEVTGQTLSDLVGPVAKAKLLDTSTGPIFSKPLRALPFPMQVGNIDAMTWLMGITPPFIETTEEFVRLLHEVLALADVDDANLITKPATHKQETWLKTLRMSCLKFLRATMANPEFLNKPNLVPSRSRVIQAYFKHVYSSSSEIVDIAHEGLRDVLKQQNKLPKEVLQSGLRPILVNLADAKRLSVSGLDGLARFLELLTSYFKVEIGMKLLDHFETLGDQQALMKAAYSPLDDNPDISRMTRLVKIFRLLPPNAVQYLPNLVQRVVDVEAALQQSSPGPFTEDLAKFLDRYKTEGAQILLDNLRNSRYVWTFRNIIASGHAPNLTEMLSNKADEICQICFADAEDTDAVLPGLQLIRELALTSPTWLSDRQSCVEALVGIWRHILRKARNPKVDMSGIQYQQIPSLVLELLMLSLQNWQHIQLMFHVVEAYEIRSAIEISNVSFFLYQQAALQPSVEYRRDILEQFFTLYEDEEVTWAFKTNALRTTVNPILQTYFSDPGNDGSLMTQPLVQRISQLIWSKLGTTLAARQLDDALLIEVFALTTLILKHCPTKVSDTRKDVFKLAWMGINLLEPTVKLMAYVLVAHFMATYDTPLKFVRLTWTGLLRLKETESRSLYRQALDILASALSARDPPGPNAIPEWAQRVRSVLTEDGHATGQLVTVCELLVNHPNLFYEYRELYVPHIASSLHKLAFPQAATPEMKRLTVDVAELIFKWEKRRLAAKDEAKEESMDVDEPIGKRIRQESTDLSPMKKTRIDRAGTAASSGSGGAWAAPSQVRELVAAHLLRLISTSNEPLFRGTLAKRALDLFREMIGPRGLPNVNVKLAFFHRTMTQDVNENNINVVANSAEVVAATAAVKDQNWVRGNLSLLTKLLEKVWKNEDSSLHDTVRELTENMFKEMPDDEETAPDSDGKTLLAFVQSMISEGLTASLRSSSHLPGTLFVLKTWLKAKPNQRLPAETTGSALLRVLANLVKAHTTNGSDPTRLIIPVLDILRDHVADLKDHRRHLNSILGTLIDRSYDVNMCNYLLNMMRRWVLDDPEPTSQGKEKASLLLKMAVFEHRDEQLFHKYLDLIYDVYENDSLRGTDITHRLEPAFLLGAKSKLPAQRAKFLDKLEQSLPQNLDARLQTLFSLHNWDTLAGDYWIPQILSMLLSILDHHQPLLRKSIPSMFEDDNVAALAADATTGDLIQPARNLIHFDSDLAHRLWIAIFPMCWSSLQRTQQISFTGYVVKLLSKEYHTKQVEMRPNVIRTFLEGILPCNPPITLPPLLVKYLAKTFNAWYVGFEILTKLSDVYRPDDQLRDSCASALSELYAELAEDDMFYGLARGRCVFAETTAALTYEQNGQWPKAIELYEQAQMKARNGLLPFSEEEYCFWEDHWILAAEKLQHWDHLTDLARVDQDSDLLLECAWRLSDWGSLDREMIESNINRVVDIPTPRRKTFEAFSALLKAHLAREPPNDFLRILDEAQQVTLRKWVTLPTHITSAHLPLLQMFQQCVELSEAAQVFDSLAMTNQQNLEVRVNSDLKTVFQAWRDRLPNFWDDIMVWSDLLAWRQHIFQSVTRVYVPLIPQGETATHGYKGYHETAWMINRFGEVARRHGLLDVCSVALNRIYALPNIEISEAFLKLREQALCFFLKPDKFNDGLENISTTNLMYFAPAQKAEFLTLKGMFIGRLGQNEDANAEFAHAIQMDMNLAKAWAEWGKFNDKLYGERPEHPISGPPEPKQGEQKMSDEQWAMSYAHDRALLASSAVSCYLQAAGLYNNHKSRALLLRVLWLLGLDDQHNTISKAFENYKGDLVIWYWLTLIPQLLLSLSHREAKQARLLLLRISKMFPQALFYHLRVSREDFGNVKKQQLSQRNAAARRATEQAAKAALQNGGSSDQANAEKANGAAKEIKTEEANANGNAGASGNANANGNANGNQANTQSGAVQQQANGTQQPQAGPPVPQQPPGPRQPWELVEEVMNSLKTQFPLLALTMEKMVDQISLRAKPSSDEDIYRFFAALLADALGQCGGRGGSADDDGELSNMTKDNLAKFANNLSGELKAAIEKDFMKDMPKLREYIKRLQWWRDTYEKSLDARTRVQALDQGGCNLIDFHHSKFDDVEVPGQYLQHVDQNEDFVKIARFSPKAELGRGHGHCFRRITMIGSDGSTHTFNVQMPAARHCRREERLTQLFRIMNSVLARRKESRRRNIQFHLPIAVALAPQLRLVENDSSYISLQDIFDDFCNKKGMSREDSIMTFHDRFKQLYDPTVQRSDPKYHQLRSEIMAEIQTKMIPETILTNYMIKTMNTPESLWLMRKQFAIETASVMFLTFVCCLSNRAPSRFHLSRKTGRMYMTEILPAFAPGKPVIASSESVPFRLTPNMQHFLTRVGIEGVVTAVATAIGNSLTMPEFDLAGTLSLFIRDEILIWHNTYNKEPHPDLPITNHVAKNVQHFIERAAMLGFIGESRDKTSSAHHFHAIVTLISQATSPELLAQMPENFVAWY